MVAAADAVAGMEAAAEIAAAAAAAGETLSFYTLGVKPQADLFQELIFMTIVC